MYFSPTNIVHFSTCMTTLYTHLLYQSCHCSWKCSVQNYERKNIRWHHNNSSKTILRCNHHNRLLREGEFKRWINSIMKWTRILHTISSYITQCKRAVSGQWPNRCRHRRRHRRIAVHNFRSPYTINDTWLVDCNSIVNCPVCGVWEML